MCQESVLESGCKTKFFYSKIFTYLCNILRRGDIVLSPFLMNYIIHFEFVQGKTSLNLADMRNVEERVRALALEKIADRDDLFIVDVRMQSNRKLLVLVDGDQGVSIQDCADISRHV